MNTGKLNILSLIAVFGGMLGAFPVQAAVNMISVEHRVWGDAGDSGGILNTYDEAGPVPLSRNAAGTSENNPFGTAYHYVSSSASDWSVSAFRDGDAFYANAYAQNRYVFKPRSRELSISLSGMIGDWWMENEALLTLTDISASSLVISQSRFYTGISPFPDDPFARGGYTINWDTTVQVDPEHEYELIIFVGAHRGEGGEGSASLNLMPIPEPGGTLLAGVAVLIVCGRRYKPV